MDIWAAPDSRVGRVGFGACGHGEPCDSAVGPRERSKPLGILPPHGFLHPLVVQIYEAAQQLEVAILVVKKLDTTGALMRRGVIAQILVGAADDRHQQGVLWGDVHVVCGLRGHAAPPLSLAGGIRPVATPPGVAQAYL